MSQNATKTTNIGQTKAGMIAGPHTASTSKKWAVLPRFYLGVKWIYPVFTLLFTPAHFTLPERGKNGVKKGQGASDGSVQVRKDPVDLLGCH